MACHDLISNSDIENIYSSLVDEVSFSTTPECENDNKKKCNILLKKETTTIVQAPIENEYLRSAPLRSGDGQGKIAVNKLIRLKDEYKGKGLAKAFHNNEVETYQSNQFQEIQLDAAWDGLVVWGKLGFQYYKPEKSDPMLYMLWSNFFSSSFNLTAEEKMKIIDTYEKYTLVPDKYKKGFGTWLENSNIHLAFPMYKVIPQGGE